MTFTQTNDAKLFEKSQTKMFLGTMPMSDIHLGTLIEKPGRPSLSSIIAKEVETFSWNGRSLAALIPEKGQPPRIDAKSYETSEPFWMASSSQAFPHRRSVAAAQLVAEAIESAVHEHDSSSIEKILAGVSYKAYVSLCQFYDLNRDDTEVLFDDNATLATYQFLGMVETGDSPHLVSSVDIGHTMKLALGGKKAEELMFGFTPALDIWGNSSIDHSLAQSVGPFQTHLIDTFHDKGYQTDTDFIAAIQRLLEEYRPKLFIIPTVTSSGRILPFIAACRLIREYAQSAEGYNPVVILDDAQGCGRMSASAYREEAMQTIWDYADAILMTGAKVMGALPGSSAMLINKSRFQTFERQIEKNPLLYRARKYGFISNDPRRTNAYNELAGRLCNAPEIASLTQAALDVDLSLVASKALASASDYARDRLRQMSGVHLVEGGSEGSTTKSIVAFYLADHPKSAKVFRDALLRHEDNSFSDHLPVTLPKLIETEQRDYLRIALDPARISPDYSNNSLEKVFNQISANVTSLEV